MARQGGLWAAGVVVGTVIGAAIGLAIAWRVWPVTYTNTSPAVLRQDFHDEYILIVATAYEAEGDLARARQRLDRLESNEPAASVREVAERLKRGSGRDEDIARLIHLTQALERDVEADATDLTSPRHLQGHLCTFPYLAGR